jgi:iron complex outermembrane receptor protein
MNRKLFGPLLIATQLGLGLTLPTHADEPQTAKLSPESNGEADTLSEIVVTARRKSELLEDVPQTVTAVSSAELQKLNLQNLKDISGVVPGLQILSEPGGAQDTNSFRGVSFNPATGTQNTVAFYLNDVWVTNNFVNTSNFDVGQIEVLSGPQGTLRGEPAPSGSLTITTHKPDLRQFGGYVTVTGTAYDNTNENGAVNLPIIQDRLAVRLAGIADDNDFDGVKSLFSAAAPYSHTYAGRASVRFEPIDSVEANVTYQHSFTHIQSYAQVAGPGATGGVSPSAPANYNGPAITPFQLLGVQSYPSENYTTEDIVTAQLDWHFLGQLVSYDGSYWKYSLNGGNAPDAAHQIPGIDAASPIPRLPFQLIRRSALSERIPTSCASHPRRLF